MSFVYLKELYPIGIDASNATEESIQRFERWKTSKSFACLSEQEAFESFPMLFLEQNQRYYGKAAFRPDIVSECFETYEREYPLKDGRLVIKRVAWIRVENGGNPEFGDSYPESMYFFRDGTRLSLAQGDHMVFNQILELHLLSSSLLDELVKKCILEGYEIPEKKFQLLEECRLMMGGEIRPFVLPFVLRRFGLTKNGRVYFKPQT